MRVSLVGVGNVGYHLAQRFTEKGVLIHQIFGRNLQKINALANELGTTGTTDLATLSDKSTIYILAIKDDAIAEVAAQLAYLNHPSRIFAHTSGATSSKILAPYFQNYGIFYPLQTFSRAVPIDFDTLPICICANDPLAEQQLVALAKQICPNVYHLSDEQRQGLHVGAVMVNNFTNHLFAIAADICQQQQLPFELLKPLIRETVNKLAYLNPKVAQTGPALRGDQGTVNTHLNYLNNFPVYSALYKNLSDSIQTMYGISPENKI